MEFRKEIDLSMGRGFTWRWYLGVDSDSEAKLGSKFHISSKSLR